MEENVEHRPVEPIVMNKENSVSKLTLVTQGEAPNVELGISEVLDIVDAAKEIKEAYDVIMEDGQVTVGDFLSHPKETLFDVGKSLLKVWDGHELIIPQLEDVEFEESEEIVQAVVIKLNVTGEKAKEIISNSIKGIYHFYAAIRAF